MMKVSCVHLLQICPYEHNEIVVGQPRTKHAFHMIWKFFVDDNINAHVSIDYFFNLTEIEIKKNK
jgi:hypothetical protein